MKECDLVFRVLSGEEVRSPGREEMGVGGWGGREWEWKVCEGNP